ncbi:MAG TPA: rod-binding protein [Rhizomicrobium sp.]|jgi:Rod binding domain-containing protein
MDATLQTAMLATQPASVQAPGATSNKATAAKSAKEFEGVFIAQFLGSMFQGIPTDGPMGGGQGEEMFRSMMVNEYAKSIADKGGFGLADSVSRQLLRHQEAPQLAAAAS